MTSTTSGSASPVSKEYPVDQPTRNNQKTKMGIPEVPKPNLAEYRAKIEAAQSSLDSLFQQMNGLTDEIGLLNQGSSDFNKKREDLRIGLDKTQKEMDDLEAEKSRLMNQIEDTTKTGRDMKSRVQELKGSLGFQTSAEIDAKIRELERMMIAKRLTVNEENKIISQIRTLEKSKPLVTKYAHMEVDANLHSQTSILPLRIRLDEIREVLKEKQQKKRNLSEKFGELMTARNKANAPLRDLVDKRNDLRSQIVNKRLEINLARDEMSTKEREYDAYKAKLNRLEGEQRAETRKQRALDKQKADLEEKLATIQDDAWSPQLMLTSMTVAYLKKLMSKMISPDDAATENARDENEEDLEINEDGMEIMKPKNQRNEVFYFAPTKKKTVKKVKKQIISLDQPLVHDLRTLQDFNQLHIQAPNTLKECPEILSSLELKMKTLLEEHDKISLSVESRKTEILSKLQALEISSKSISV